MFTALLLLSADRKYRIDFSLPAHACDTGDGVDETETLCQKKLAVHYYDTVAKYQA